MAFGPLLQQLRKRAGLTTGELAEKLEVSEATVKGRERESSNLTEGVLLPHLVGLGATLHDLAEAYRPRGEDSAAINDALISALRAMHEKTLQLESRVKASTVTAEDLSLADEIMDVILKELIGQPNEQERILHALLSTTWRPRGGMPSSEVSNTVSSMISERKRGNGS